MGRGFQKSVKVIRKSLLNDDEGKPLRDDSEITLPFLDNSKLRESKFSSDGDFAQLPAILAGDTNRIFPFLGMACVIRNCRFDTSGCDERRQGLLRRDVQ